MSRASVNSVVGFKHRLANYFERISGDISHLKQILDTLPKAYSSPESQDTLMRFISERCGIEEAEAAEELDYVTARLERERRNERFERLLEPWTTEQLEASLRQYFALHDPRQIPTVSALVTFYRGREITLIRELELQYRKPVLLHRDDDDDVREDEAGAMDLAQAAALTAQTGGENDDVDVDVDNDDDEKEANINNNTTTTGDDDAASLLLAGGGEGEARCKNRNSNKNFKRTSSGGARDNNNNNNDSSKSGGVTVATITSDGSERKTSVLKKSAAGATSSSTTSFSSSSSHHHQQPQHQQHHGATATVAGVGQALRIKTNWEDITVDSMQQFEMDILRFLLEIRQELQDRIKESEFLAQQYAATAAAEDAGDDECVGQDSTVNNNNNNNNNIKDQDQIIPLPSLARRRALRKSSTIRRVLAASQLAKNLDGQHSDSPSKNTGSGDFKESKNRNLNSSNNINNKNTSNTNISIEDVTYSVTELTSELAALPRKRLGRVERIMQIIPLIARAVTPIFNSQLLLYLGFYCSLRVEARKVMQKRIAGNLHDAPLKADENFQRRAATIFATERESRAEIGTQERRIWGRMDPLFYRERLLRMVATLIEDEEAAREETAFDEFCVSSVARAKLRSLLFIERSFVDLNFSSSF